MSEESQIYSKAARKWCDMCHKKEGTHCLHEFYWLCESCFRVREQERQAPFIDWSTKGTIDNLTEAVHYFAELQRGKNYRSFWQSGDMFGSKGIISYVLDMFFDVKTAFNTVVEERYRYYLLYNRRYLEYGDKRFERASSMHGPWQTVNKKVIDAAALENMVGQFRNHVCIVIVMQNKTVWYINPSLMKKFCFEYETEDIPYGETELEGHIPVNREPMISGIDPFIKSQIQN